MMGQADHFLELMGMFSANLFKQDCVDDVCRLAKDLEFLKPDHGEFGDLDDGEK